jgi:flagellar basal body rod protein FlgG
MVQGSVESSNVEAVTEMVKMIEANRSYATIQKAITAQDEMNRQAITLARV